MEKVASNTVVYANSKCTSRIPLSRHRISPIFITLLCICLLSAMGGCYANPRQSTENTAPTLEQIETGPISYTLEAQESNPVQIETEPMPEYTESIPEESTDAEDTTGDTASSNTIPDYWYDPLFSGAYSIRKTMQTAGMNKSSFFFYTDSHWNHSSRRSPQLIKYLYDNTPINKVIFGGDIVTTEPAPNEVDESNVMDYLWQWRSEIRDLKHYSVVGNHDDGEETNNLFSYEYVYSYLFAPEDSNEITRGGSTFYYFDDICEKTRYLCLDTAYEGMHNMSNEQISFIIESLKSTPNGWHIIVAAHIWFMPDYDNHIESEPIPVLGLSPKAAALAEILDQYNSRTGQFQKCGAKVEFCVGGHIHRDYVGATPGGIPIILFESDSKHTRGGLEYVKGTTSEAVVSGVVADYSQGIVSVIRVGRGSSFEVNLNPSTVQETTPDDNYVNVLDTVGYSDRYRFSAGSGNMVVNANTDTTGLIPVKMGDILRLKNITMPDTVDNYYAVIAYYLPDHTFLDAHFVNSNLKDVSPVYDKNKNLIQFTMTNEWAGYIRICAKQIDEASIITINERID